MQQLQESIENLNYMIRDNMIFCFLVRDMKLATATVRWFELPRINSALSMFPKYNVTLRSGNDFYLKDESYNKTSITFTNLKLRAAHTLIIRALSTTGVLAVGTVGFYSPGRA